MPVLSEAKLSKWPFFLGDVLLLGAAYSIYHPAKLAPGPWQMAFAVLCVAVGAWLAILPFVLEYRAAMKVAEAGALTTVVAQIQNVERLAGQIGNATGQWQNVQEQADKVAGSAREIAERMAAEVRGFTEFLQKANEGEKANLRLEVEKLRRAENDWLQVLVRILDHVFALHQGAVRSGQPNLITQLANFQNSCREAARRVGLVPFAAGDSEPFDPKRHQLVEGDAKTAADGIIAETMASGYTFQGKLLRPALVRLQTDAARQPAPGGLVKTEPEDKQGQLSLKKE
ncbi:MAG: nucleotide exchange factor GrpE [Verrucomicrobia bacterium]|nr:MAG: nucleotide exchange factor GrpE [Verrucomicrobiota bacterium]